MRLLSILSCANGARPVGSSDFGGDRVEIEGGSLGLGDIASHLTPHTDPEIDKLWESLRRLVEKRTPSARGGECDRDRLIPVCQKASFLLGVPVETELCDIDGCVDFLAVAIEVLEERRRGVVDTNAQCMLIEMETAALRGKSGHRAVIEGQRRFINALVDRLDEFSAIVGDLRSGRMEREVEALEECARKQQMLQRQMESAIAERDEALAQKQIVLSERNDAIAERDESSGQRDKAVAEREDALARCNDALEERDKAVAQLNEAVEKQNDALTRQNEAFRQRDEAFSQRNAAISEQKSAERIRDEAMMECEETCAQILRMQRRQDEMETLHRDLTESLRATIEVLAGRLKEGCDEIGQMGFRTIRPL